MAKSFFKTTDNAAWHNKCLECLDKAMGINYGSGAFDSDGDGYEDEQYKIIIGYDEDILTESFCYKTNIPERIASGDSIIVIWNDSFETTTLKAEQTLCFSI